MRLLRRNNSGGFCFSEDFVDDERIPDYAILSHTWGEAKDEVTFNDILNCKGQSKPGYDKIRFCGDQARQDALDYFWIDTCCIDKSSSTELSYAINSMFRWYAKSKVCYAYLCDVPSPEVSLTEGPEDKSTKALDLLRASRWFTRGWTLQELLAPAIVIFYDVQWTRITDKYSSRGIIHEITNIPVSVLEKSFDLWSAPFRPKTYVRDTRLRFWSTTMSWCSNRETSRPEDIAYCLLGIFDVNLTLRYGEGRQKAFKRLQYEMVKRASSSSLLAWNLDMSLCIRSSKDLENIFRSELTPLPIFADSPHDFSGTPMLSITHPLPSQVSDFKPWIVSNVGVQLEVLLLRDKSWFNEDSIGDDGIQRRCDFAIVILPFRILSSFADYVGVLVAGDSERGLYGRVATPNGTASLRVSGRIAVNAEPQIIFLSDRQVVRELRAPSCRRKIVYLESNEFLVQVITLSRCDWNADEQALELNPDNADHVQGALMKIVDDSNERLIRSFYLLISNSVTKQDNVPSSQLESCHWHFRTLGIGLVSDDLACELLGQCNDSVLQRELIQVKAQDIVVHKDGLSVDVVVKEGAVSWDLIYSIHITQKGPKSCM